MKLRYHREITSLALGEFFDSLALEQVIQANLGQDALRFQVGHDHFHYDNNAFEAGDAHLEKLRRATLDALSIDHDHGLARRSFGQLTHTAQDFYAHSDYVTHWREQNPGAAPEQIAPYPLSPLKGRPLRSGRLYYPLEAFSFIEPLKPLVMPFLPRDSHAWMNKDAPHHPDFDYAFHAAVKHTLLEYQQIVRALSPEQHALFTGKHAHDIAA